MSVESEILRIQHNIANTYAVVSEKGGEVPLQPTSANLAAAVDSIPQTLPPLDNNPIGTVISYMGLTAPKDYLACDGAEYNIADYPSLASHFQQQFGSSNHFGGDGETTFAVPDMRNLFLRGYHGDAEKQLSGDVGAKQEATQHPLAWNAGSNFNIIAGATTKNSDESPGSVGGYLYTRMSTYSASSNSSYTSRPVNMAVLYCIKATESYPAENVYSTEEIRIGTWINGKSIYRKVYQFNNKTFNGDNDGYGISFDIRTDFMDEIISTHWNGKYTSGSILFRCGGDDVICNATSSDVRIMHSLFSGTYILSGTITLEYTKNDG